MFQMFEKILNPVISSVDENLTHTSLFLEKDIAISSLVAWEP